MADFPTTTDVAITVSDLRARPPWYKALLRVRILVAAFAAMMVVSALPAQAQTAHGAHAAGHDRHPARELAGVKRVTDKYHSLSRALADGFVAFSLDPNDPDVPTCFDSPNGGMGVHYVRNIDATLDARDPEAMVYEVGRDGRLKLVAVEYIVPEDFVDPANPPMLFGQMLHHHPSLPVYILHAWIWKTNPDGIFADFNPRVGACPA